MCCINADGAGAWSSIQWPAFLRPYTNHGRQDAAQHQAVGRPSKDGLGSYFAERAGTVHPGAAASPHEVRDAWQNKLYRTSLTEVASTLPYSLHTNRSQSSKRLLGTHKSWPSNCMACPSPLARSLKATFLPRRPNELTESHPVKAWKPGSASQIFAPRDWESWLRLKHRVF